LEKDLKNKQKLLNDTIDLLGAEEIKTLADISNLLKGRTLKQLIDAFDQKEKNLNQELLERQKRIVENNQAY
jgi:hypothetical protein